MNITGSIVRGNAGDGIANSYMGSALLIDTTIHGNTNVGISNSNRMTVFASTISGNTGGGVANMMNGAMTVINSTISGNSVTEQVGNGGGFRNFDGVALALVNSTVSGNAAVSGSGYNGYGGGIYNGGFTMLDPPVVSLVNTIVAGNYATNGSPDLHGMGNRGYISSGHNLIGKTDGSIGWASSDLIGTIATPLNAHLLPLAYNGGATQTTALGPSSPAVNAADPSVCTGTLVNGNDQRGLSRPAAACAIGAFEPHSLAGIAPATGPAAGGNAVTLVGSGFTSDATVTLGGVAATNVSVVNGSTITAVTPAHAPGNVDVAVTTGGITLTLTGGYSFIVQSAPAPRPPSGGVSGTPPNPRPPSLPAPTAGGGTPVPLPGGR